MVESVDCASGRAMKLFIASALSALGTLHYTCVYKAHNYYFKVLSMRALTKSRFCFCTQEIGSTRRCGECGVLPSRTSAWCLHTVS